MILIFWVAWILAMTMFYKKAINPASSPTLASSKKEKGYFGKVVCLSWNQEWAGGLWDKGRFVSCFPRLGTKTRPDRLRANSQFSL